MTDISKLLQQGAEQVRRLSPEARDEMLREQAESWARGEGRWPKAKFKFVNGTKVYESYEDYCND